MKKNFLIILFALTLVFPALIFFACDNGDSGNNGSIHVHSYILKYDEENHWKECSCGGVIEFGHHFGGVVSCEHEAVCSVCHAPYGEVSSEHTFLEKWEYNEQYHWHPASCCHSDQISNKSGHSYSNIVVESALKTPATCISYAVYYKSCVCGKKCDVTFQDVDGGFASHQFSEWHENVLPTHENDGHVGYYECLCCHQYFNENYEEINNITLGKLSHTYSETWDYDDDYHWHDCLCECEGVNAKDYAKHSKNYLYSSDENKHWKECSVCGYHCDEEEHVYDQEKTNQKFLVSSVTCTSHAIYYKSCKCGKASTTQTFEDLSSEILGHDYNEENWESDENGHWQICERCEERINIASHVSSETYYEDINYHWHICEVCGTVLNKELHEYDETNYKRDDDYHWFECECGKKSSVSKHRFNITLTEPTSENDGYYTYTCECGYSYQLPVQKLKYGSAEACNADLVVNSSDVTNILITNPNNVTVTYEDSNFENKKWYSGWYVGFKIKVPDNFNYNSFYSPTYSIDGIDSGAFFQFSDDETYMTIWFTFAISSAVEPVINLQNENGTFIENVEKVIAVDWNGDKVYDQSFTFSIDIDKLILKDKNGSIIFQNSLLTGNFIEVLNTSYGFDIYNNFSTNTSLTNNNAVKPTYFDEASGLDAGWYVGFKIVDLLDNSNLKIKVDDDDWQQFSSLSTEENSVEILLGLTNLNSNGMLTSIFDSSHNLISNLTKIVYIDFNGDENVDQTITLNLNLSKINLYDENEMPVFECGREIICLDDASSINSKLALIENNSSKRYRVVLCEDISVSEDILFSFGTTDVEFDLRNKTLTFNNASLIVDNCELKIVDFLYYRAGKIVSNSAVFKVRDNGILNVDYVIAEGNFVEETGGEIYIKSGQFSFDVSEFCLSGSVCFSSIDYEENIIYLVIVQG